MAPSHHHMVTDSMPGRQKHGVELRGLGGRCSLMGAVLLLTMCHSRCDTLLLGEALGAPKITVGRQAREGGG